MRKVWPWAVAAAVFIADRVTKILAPGIPENGVVLIPGVIGLRYAENRGIAFSLLSGAPWALGVVSLLIIAAAFFCLRGKKLQPLALTGLMMMLGGAAGNMVDRFVHGFVPDMIEVLFVNFAIFNVADTFLCIGCGLVIISLLRKDTGLD
ncbi:MAG: signal peptidase II [Clostridia bacterium]|nr:signal peptidase II [Clostridia bacterium]